jgi:hypothetical protein
MSRKSYFHLVFCFSIWAQLMLCGGDGEGNRALSYKEVLLRSKPPRSSPVQDDPGEGGMNVAARSVKCTPVPPASSRHKDVLMTEQRQESSDAPLLHPGVLSYADVLKLNNSTAKSNPNRTTSLETESWQMPRQDNRRITGMRRTPSPQSHPLPGQHARGRRSLSDQSIARDLEGARQFRLLSKYSRQQQGGSFSYPRRAWRTGPEDVVRPCQVKIECLL